MGTEHDSKTRLCIFCKHYGSGGWCKHPRQVKQNRVVGGTEFSRCAVERLHPWLLWPAACGRGGRLWEPREDAGKEPF